MEKRYTSQQMIARWSEAYEAANHRSPPRVTYESGWFVIHGDICAAKHRYKEVEQMTARLLRRFEEED